METRCAVGEFDPTTDEFTLHTTSQNPHVIRLLMGAFVLHLPEHKLRVVAPDVGGGFGSKIFHYAEEAIVTWAAGKLAQPGQVDIRPVRSLRIGRPRPRPCQRGGNGRGSRWQVPRPCGSRPSANMGAYLSTFAPSDADLPVGNPAGRRVYSTPVIYGEVKAVFTNTVPVDAYRGAGRPETTYLLERLVDVIAHDTGHRPGRAAAQEFHRRPTPFPYQTPVALNYDSGDYIKTLDACTEGAADWSGFAAPPGRGCPAGQAARHRHVHLCRGLRHRPVQAGGPIGRTRRAL